MTVHVKIYKDGILVEEKDIETKVVDNEESTIQPKRKSRKAADKTSEAEQTED